MSHAKESPKTRRARKRLESLVNEEQKRITPEALEIERKKISQRIKGQKERIELKDLKSLEELFDKSYARESLPEDSSMDLS